MSKEYRCKKIAWQHFYPEGKGQPKPGHVLHHIDPSWKTEDPVRYAEWRIEDLVMMTKSEHVSFHMQGNKYTLGRHPSEEERRRLSIARLNSDWQLSDEGRESIRRAMMGNDYVKDLIWWTNGVEDRRSKECPGEGWQQGRSNGSNDGPTGYSWWNNGAESVMSLECPGEGWKPGRLLAKSPAGSHCWNNGVEMKFQQECPGEGWVLGRLDKFSEETLQRLSEAFTGLVYWNNGEINKRSKDCPGEGWVRGKLK